MINARVKVITADGGSNFERNLNTFLATIDIRQVIKTEHFEPRDSFYRAVIYYVNFEDIREVKIDNVLKF